MRQPSIHKSVKLQDLKATKIIHTRMEDEEMSDLNDLLNLWTGAGYAFPENYTPPMLTAAISFIMTMVAVAQLLSIKY